MFSRLEDPRVLTVFVTGLFAAALWAASWSTMGAMDMASMSGGMGGGMGSGTDSGVSSGMGGAMAAPGGMGGSEWSARIVLGTSAMWLLMMAAMMLPAMAPVLSVYAGAAAKEDEGVRLAARIGLFGLGYFALWAAFSVGAAGLQLWWRDSAWFTMGGTMATPAAAGVLLLIAGAYQFSGVKHVCLKHCRHPLQYLLAHWRPGLGGAFQVGARHGLYCFGCCVAFMGLMFVFGAMNVWWMAAIALYFLAEKTLPAAEAWGRVVGGLLVLAGLATLLGGI